MIEIVFGGPGFHKIEEYRHFLSPRDIGCLGKWGKLVWSAAGYIFNAAGELQRQGVQSFRDEVWTEILDDGEVVYAAGSQIRTRRWTWRQSQHGEIEPETSYVFFPIDGFTDFNKAEVLAARDELEQKLKDVFGCETLVGFLDAEHPEMVWE